MKNFTLMVVLLLLGTVSYAQDTIRVSPDYTNGGALNTAIADNGANKVYVLEANGFYTLTSTIEFLRPENDPTAWYHIVGETPTGDEYMPVLQTGLTAENTPFERMFTVKADVKFKNIFIANQTTTGEIAGYNIFCEDKVNLEVDGCMVDPIGRTSFIQGNELTGGSVVRLTNNTLLRHGDEFGPNGGHLIWGVYADTMYIENNSIISTDQDIINANDAADNIDFIWFNHNTIVFHDVRILPNRTLPEAYLANNLYYDLTAYIQQHAWAAIDPEHGTTGTYPSLARAISIDSETLPSTRIQKWDRNALYVSQATKDLLLGAAANDPSGPQYWQFPVLWNEDVPEYFVTDWADRGQAILDNSREAKMFSSTEYPNFVESNTWYDENPNFVDSRIEAHSIDAANSALHWFRLNALMNGENSGEQKSQFWDVDGWAGTSAAQYPTVWPRWNGAYTNETLLKASTGGYPLGDLNAFPEEKAKWETEKDAIMEQIMSLEREQEVVTKDTIYVAPDYTNGGALNKAIEENGTNKVYVLEANGFYTLTSTIEFLRDSLNPDYGYEILGEISATEATKENYMPVIQTGLTAENTPFERMFTVKADVKFKNIFIANQTTTGEIAGYNIFCEDKVNLEVDGCMVDPIGRTSFIQGNELTGGSVVRLTNNTLLRHGDEFGPNGGHLIWGVYADTMYIENNSIISTDQDIINANDATDNIDFIWFNHNTIVFHDVRILPNRTLPEAYLANNLYYDLTSYIQQHGWAAIDPEHGTTGTYPSLARAISIDSEALPSTRTQMWDRNALFVSQATKEILLGTAANDPEGPQYWQFPVLWNEDVPEYFVTDWADIGQTILDNSREAKIFGSTDYPNLVENNTWYDENPNFVDPRVEAHSVDVAESALYWFRLNSLMNGENSGEQKSQFWDVDGWAGTSAAQYPTEWPRWNGAFTNEELLTASTGGYPLGDLNAFPEEKAKWEAEKSAIMGTILSLETVDQILTSVDETNIDVESSIRISPNPANNSFRVESKTAIKNVNIYSVTGSLISINEGAKDIDISKLPKGVYVVKVELVKGGAYSSKLIKQ